MKALREWGIAALIVLGMVGWWRACAFKDCISAGHSKGYCAADHYDVPLDPRAN